MQGKTPENPGNVPARNKWQRKGNVILHVACSDFPVDGIHRSSMDSLSTIHRNRASGGGHLRTGALPARHSCELALLSCFPYQQSPLINAGVFNSSKNNRGPSPECVYVVSGSATSWFASEGKNLSRRDLN